MVDRRGRLQAKDVGDADFLSAMATVMDIRQRNVASRWDVQAVLSNRRHFVGTNQIIDDDTPGVIHSKVVTAKARKLIRRGLIDGCYCGCRGDYEFRQGDERELLEVWLKRELARRLAEELWRTEHRDRAKDLETVVKSTHSDEVVSEDRNRGVTRLASGWWKPEGSDAAPTNN